MLNSTHLDPSNLELSASICFFLAIAHTFSVKRFQHLALKYPEGSVLENIFHLLGEIEIIFGFWGALFLLFFSVTQGKDLAITYLESCNFTEPVFVFIIMVVCSTKPILNLASSLLSLCSRALPFSEGLSLYLVCLTIGPLLGSFITEPAAMTVTALILLDKFYSRGISSKLMYATLGLLFVNVSIGGTLTPYAAPPVLMVSKLWNWDLTFMLTHFGWKAILAMFISTSLTCWIFRAELNSLTIENSKKAEPMPYWVIALHFVFLFGIISTSHHMVAFCGLFLFFLGLTTVTKEYQTELKLREGLLVGFFLGGLVVLGGYQRWWLEPLLTSMDEITLYFGAIGLTAVTDNAALTYLGSQVSTLPESSRYALVAGAVVGGGLTVIANAPNPAGYGILNPTFKTDGKSEGISPLQLLKNALIPTIIAAACFWLL